jgi:arylsulfatase A-like enzyme
MFEQFSRGYYLGRLYVEPQNTDAATMCREQHERVNQQLYGSAEGGTDLPLVMKLGTRHFPVHGDRSVPADTLAVPPTIIDAADIRNPPTLREVFLAKADRAAQLLEFEAGGKPTGV